MVAEIGFVRLETEATDVSSSASFGADPTFVKITALQVVGRQAGNAVVVSEAKFWGLFTTDEAAATDETLSVGIFAVEFAEAAAVVAMMDVESAEFMLSASAAGKDLSAGATNA